jgi:uncharacterized protein YegL
MLRILSVLGIVMLLTVACTPVTLAPQPVTTEPPLTSSTPSLRPSSPFGINGGLGLRFSNDAERDRVLQLLLDADIQWQREEFIWNAIEPVRGQFYWGPMDSAVSKQSNAGINMLGLIDYGAAWWGEQGEPYYDKDVPSPVTPEMIGEWQNYVREVVQRYRGAIHYWEIWNEENIEDFWKPLPSETDYAQLLRAAYETIKQEDPGATVLLGGTSGVDLDWIDRVVRASGGVQYFDVVNVHPYIWDKNDPWCSPERRALREYIAPSTRYGKPVWLTEIGWSTPPDGQITESLQARYLMRAYMISMTTPGIEKIFWYNFRNSDTGNLDEDNYGLVRRDFSQKETFYAYQAMARALEGAQFAEKVREGQYVNGQLVGDDVYEYRFTRGREVVVALWKSEGGDVTRPVAVENLLTDSVRLTSPGAGMAAPWTTDILSVTADQVVVDLDETPVFLTYTPRQQPTPGQATPTLPSPIGGAETATILLVDVSGSMGREWQGGYKIESAQQAALSVVDMIEQESQSSGVGHEISVATFSSGAWLDLPLTTDYGQVRQVIQSLYPQRNTNMGAGLQQANQALQAASNDKKIIILLSDGLSNEGLSADQILSGPVQDAAQAGTCIYTVGFGDPGDLDENLLRQIAQAACGQYSYASTPFELQRVYVEIRHRSAGGTIIDRFSGQVRQGETTEPRPVEVARNQGEMHITGTYGGSRLDLAITDPRGRKVDANYPGVTLSTYARMVYMIVKEPIEGIWQVAVHGAEVPEGILPYEVILSTRPSIVPRGPSTAGIVLLIVFLGVLVGGGLVAAILYSQRRAVRRPAWQAPPRRAPSAGVQFASEPGRWAGFQRGSLHIGREPTYELALSDPRVSRSHARIVETAEGYLIEDLNSTNGTFVNGERVTRQYLRPGDQIQVGDTQLIFWVGGR